MANETTIEIQVDPIFGSRAKNKVKKESQKLGETAGKKFSDSFGISVKSFLSIAAATAAIKKSFDIMGDSIRAAVGQEDAINKFNSALKISGRFTASASEGFQKYASSLQEVTKFGDEVILQNAALLQSLGNLDDKGLKAGTKAAIDMAAALGVSLESAITLVGKAASGEIGSFSRYGVIIKKGKDNAETFSNVLYALNKQFGGAAEAEVNTYSGAVTQLSNAFGDTLEAIGRFVIKSPAVRTAINLLKDGFVAATTAADNFAISLRQENTSEVKKRITQLVVEINDLEERLKSTSKTDNSFRVGLSGSSNASAQLTKRLAQSREELKKLEERLKSNLSTEREARIETEKNVAAQKAKADAAALATKQEEIRKKVANVGLTQEQQLKNQFREQEKILQQAFNEGVITDEQIFQERMLELKRQYNEKVKEINKQQETEAQRNAKSISQTLNSGLASGLSSGLQAIGRNIGEGKKAFADFGKTILGIVGDLSIQLGNAFIAIGIAKQKLEIAAPGAAIIAAGAGLVVIGSILKAFASKSGAGGETSGGGGIATSSPSFGSEPAPAEERVEPQAVANITVQGDILDSEDTATRLAELISTGLDQSDIQIRGRV